jgi:hypothetical protein
VHSDSKQWEGFYLKRWQLHSTALVIWLQLATRMGGKKNLPSNQFS